MRVRGVIATRERPRGMREMALSPTATHKAHFRALPCPATHLIPTRISHSHTSEFCENLCNQRTNSPCAEACPWRNGSTDSPAQRSRNQREAVSHQPESHSRRADLCTPTGSTHHSPGSRPQGAHPRSSRLAEMNPEGIHARRFSRFCPLSPTFDTAFGEDSTVGERVGVRGNERAVSPPHPSPGLVKLTNIEGIGFVQRRIKVRENKGVRNRLLPNRREMTNNGS